MKKKQIVKKVNSLQWIFEPLDSHAEFLVKKMFGCTAGYLGDRLVLVLADSEDPWNGLLVPTERELHAEIQKMFPDLTPHVILKKWLYLNQTADGFEETVLKIVDRVKRGDLRFGIDPKPKKLIPLKRKKNK